MPQQANAVQTATSTSTASPTTTSSSAGAVKGALRGQSFASQEAMLAPVQRKTPATDTTATDTTAKGKGKAPAGGGPAADVAKTARPKVAKVGKQQKLKLVQDLGTAKSIQMANAIVGHFLAMLVTEEGTSVDAELKVVVQIDGIAMKLGYGVGLEHTEHGYEMRGKLLVGIGVGFDVSVVDVMATIDGAMGFKSKGDSVGECFDLVMLALDTWLRDRTLKISATAPGVAVDAFKMLGGGVWVADRVFGRAFAGEVMKKMDAMKTAAGKENEGADTIETTQEIGLNVEAGVGLANVAELGAEGGGGVRSKQTLGKDLKSGKLATEEETGLTGKMSLAGAALGFKGQTECEYFLGDESEIELSSSLTVPQQVAQVAAWGVNAFGTYVNQLSAGALTKQGTIGARIAALVKRATSAVQNSAIKALGLLGLGACELKFKLSLKLTESALTGSFVIEIINKAELDVGGGAGLAAVDVQGSIKTGTKILDEPFTLMEKKPTKPAAKGVGGATK